MYKIHEKIKKLDPIRNLALLLGMTEAILVTSPAAGMLVHPGRAYPLDQPVNLEPHGQTLIAII